MKNYFVKSIVTIFTLLILSYAQCSYAIFYTQIHIGGKLGIEITLQKRPLECNAENLGSILSEKEILKLHNLDSKTTELVARVLRENRSIKTLVISRVNDDQTASMIAEILRQSNIEQLDIMGFDSSAARIIASALRENRSIKTINIYNQDIKANEIIIDAMYTGRRFFDHVHVSHQNENIGGKIEEIIRPQSAAPQPAAATVPIASTSKPAAAPAPAPAAAADASTSKPAAAPAPAAAAPQPAAATVPNASASKPAAAPAPAPAVPQPAAATVPNASASKPAAAPAPAPAVPQPAAATVPNASASKPVVAPAPVTSAPAPAPAPAAALVAPASSAAAPAPAAQSSGKIFYNKYESGSVIISSNPQGGNNECNVKRLNEILEHANFLAISDLEPTTAQAIASILRENRTITLLRIVNITPDAAQVIVNALRENRTITSLYIGNITPDAAQVIVNALLENRTITELAFCSINPKAAQVIVNALRGNSTIPSLTLAYIDSEVGQLISNILRENRNITQLFIQAPEPAAAYAIIDALQGNRNITKLSIQGLEPGAVRKIIDFIRSNQMPMLSYFHIYQPWGEQDEQLGKEASEIMLQRSQAPAAIPVPAVVPAPAPAAALVAPASSAAAPAPVAQNSGKIFYNKYGSRAIISSNPEGKNNECNVKGLNGVLEHANFLEISGLESEAAQAIADALGENKTITELVIGNIAPDAQQVIVNALRGNRTITELVIGNITPEAAQIIMDALHGNQMSLRHFNDPSNGRLSEDINRIIRRSKVFYYVNGEGAVINISSNPHYGNKECSLQELNKILEHTAVLLTISDLEPEAAQVIADALGENKTITELVIGNIAPEAQQVIVNALRGNRTITSLHIENIAPDAQQVIVNALRGNRTITELIIDNITPEAAQVIREALSRNQMSLRRFYDPSSERLSEDINKIIRRSKVFYYVNGEGVVTNISSNPHYGNKECSLQELNKILEHTAALLTISDLEPEAAQAIANALRENKTIIRLDLEKINLEAAQAIANALRENRTITRLHIRNIAPDVAQAIANALRENRTITELGIRDIAPGAAQAIANALLENRTITELVIGNTAPDAQQVIVNALRGNRTITWLIIDNITPEAAQVIREALSRNQMSLRRFYDPSNERLSEDINRIIRPLAAAVPAALLVAPASSAAAPAPALVPALQPPFSSIEINDAVSDESALTSELSDHPLNSFMAPDNQVVLFSWNVAMRFGHTRSQSPNNGFGYVTEEGPNRIMRVQKQVEIICRTMTEKSSEGKTAVFALQEVEPDLRDALRSEGLIVVGKMDGIPFGSFLVFPGNTPNIVQKEIDARYVVADVQIGSTKYRFVSGHREYLQGNPEEEHRRIQEKNNFVIDARRELERAEQELQNNMARLERLMKLRHEKPDEKPGIFRSFIRGLVSSMKDRFMADDSDETQQAEITALQENIKKIKENISINETELKKCEESAREAGTVGPQMPFANERRLITEFREDRQFSGSDHSPRILFMGLDANTGPHANFGHSFPSILSPTGAFLGHASLARGGNILVWKGKEKGIKSNNDYIVYVNLPSTDSYGTQHRSQPFMGQLAASPAPAPAPAPSGAHSHSPAGAEVGSSGKTAAPGNASASLNKGSIKSTGGYQPGAKKREIGAVSIKGGNNPSELYDNFLKKILDISQAMGNNSLLNNSNTNKLLEELREQINNSDLTSEQVSFLISLIDVMQESLSNTAKVQEGFKPDINNLWAPPEVSPIEQGSILKIPSKATPILRANNMFNTLSSSFFSSSSGNSAIQNMVPAMIGYASNKIKTPKRRAFASSVPLINVRDRYGR